MFITVIAVDDQQISIWYAFEDSFHIYLFVYASVLLVYFSNSFLETWYILGDFNLKLGAYEKCGKPPLKVACDDFHDAIESANLFMSILLVLLHGLVMVCIVLMGIQRGD